MEQQNHHLGSFQDVHIFCGKRKKFHGNWKTKKIQMDKLGFSPVWSQVSLMQLTLPEVPTEGVQVLLREAISLLITGVISPADFSPSLLPIAYQDEMAKTQVTLAWCHPPDPAEAQPEICPMAEFPSSTAGGETSCALCEHVEIQHLGCTEGCLFHTEGIFLFTVDNYTQHKQDCLQYQGCVKQSRAWTSMLVSREFRR